MGFPEADVGVCAAVVGAPELVGRPADCAGLFGDGGGEVLEFGGGVGGDFLLVAEGRGLKIAGEVFGHVDRGHDDAGVHGAVEVEEAGVFGTVDVCCACAVGACAGAVDVPCGEELCDGGVGG